MAVLLSNKQLLESLFSNYVETLMTFIKSATSDLDYIARCAIMNCILSSIYVAECERQYDASCRISQ